MVSKAEAADWAKETLAPRWIALIERALIGRQTPNAGRQPEDVHGTLELIRYALEYSRHIEEERSTVGN